MAMSIHGVTRRSEPGDLAQPASLVFQRGSERALLRARTGATRRARVDKIGAEQQDVAVVEDCLDNLSAWREAAERSRFAAAGCFYPGIRAPIPSTAYASLIRPLSEIISATFGYSRGARICGCDFSLVTALPQNFQPIQRLPHHDGINPNMLAVLIYLQDLSRVGPRSSVTDGPASKPSPPTGLRTTRPASNKKRATTACRPLPIMLRMNGTNGLPLSTPL
jgi:Family of unknown function (DUF6445)